MSEFRRIGPMAGVGPCPDPGRAPEIIYPRLDQLVVNEEYQRGLSKTSTKQIKRMASAWDWSSFKTPNVAITEDPDSFEVIDGQHTAIAAASNGHILILPCLLVPAVTLREKAQGFLGVNLSKIGLTRQAIYNAQLASGDEIATSVQVALNASGCRVLALPPPDGKYSVGELMAIGTLMQLVQTKGGTRLRKLLSMSKEAGAAPISAMLLKSLDLCLPRDAPDDIVARVTAVLRNQGVGRLEIIAKSRTNAGDRAYETFADMIAEMARLPARRMGTPKPKAFAKVAA